MATQTRHARRTQLKPGDLAPDVEVLDVQGRPIRLRTVWQTGPVLLTFLRHFG